MASNFSAVIHSRDRLPKMAPRINFEQGRCFISNEEFEARINEISCELWKMKEFAKFFVGNYKKIKERRLACSDGQIFVESLSVFLEKEFVSTKNIFKKTCKQYPFEAFFYF